MNIKLLQMLPPDISKKIMAISIQNLKDRLIYENTEYLCYTIYQRIDGIQSRQYDLYADKKDIIYYLERLKQLDAISVYIRTITTEWLARVYYNRVYYNRVYYNTYDYYYERLEIFQQENDINDFSMIKKYI